MSNVHSNQAVPVQQVMVSSTYTDLLEHRAALITAIQGHKFFPNVMENDSARLIDVIDSSLQMVRESAAYIGLIGMKYGQTPECAQRNPNQLSITELEFNEALRLNRPILLFIMGDEHPIKKADVEKDNEKEIKLNTFRERAKVASPQSSVNRVYAVFNSLEEFKDKLGSSLTELSGRLRFDNGVPPGDEQSEQKSNGLATHRLEHLREMEMKLQHALEAFKGQPTIFLEPKLSKKREFNDEPNELQPLMEKPRDTLIMSPPEFGLTCLGLYLQLEAFKKDNFWLYIDAEQTKSKKIVNFIRECTLHYNQEIADLKCIILDSWNADNADHLAMMKNINTDYQKLPVIILAEDSTVLGSSGNISKLNREFYYLHLQAMSKGSMRQLIANYNATKHIGTEEALLSGVAEHMESINIHRTPLNCYTLLRVLEGNHNEILLNKRKLLKAILFMIFMDNAGFSFLSPGPEVEECSFVLGRFCKDLLKQGSRHFEAATLVPALRDTAKSNCIVLNVEAMVEALIENNVLVRCGDQMAFRHRFWIFYFAAEWMQHDDEFRQFILTEHNYVNYPEIIEFYAGIDGKRTDALETVLSDLTTLMDKVENKIGIARDFDPLSTLLWNPSDAFIQKARNQIAEKVGTSNLPAEIKDKHADRQYSSTAPYDQSIGKFLRDYSVISLMNAIKAASRALRSSTFVDVELKHKVTSTILKGWEEISRVAFWISPILARDGRATHEGLAFVLAEGFSDDLDKRFKQIITSNPYNIVTLLGGDLASNKIDPLVNTCFNRTNSMIQKHMAMLFIIIVRPEGWYETALRYINLLHPRSFYIGDMFSVLSNEIKFGDLENDDDLALKRLTRAIISKREYAPNISGDKEIPPNMLLNKDNTMTIDKLMNGNNKNSKDFGEFVR